MTPAEVERATREQVAQIKALQKQVEEQRKDIETLVQQNVGLNSTQNHMIDDFTEKIAAQNEVIAKLGEELNGKLDGILASIGNVIAGEGGSNGKGTTTV